jgi:hypothetical protein
MPDVMTTAPADVDTAAVVSLDSVVGEANELRAVALTLEMESSTALLAVLTTVARLGCRTTHVHATERQATLRVLAPGRITHRLVPCLQELIDVLAVMQSECVEEAVPRFTALRK